MKSHVLLKILAPLMVALGVFSFIRFSMFITTKLEITNLFDLLHFMPKNVIRFVGAINILTFLPVFIAGICILGTDGALGNADKLRTKSIYKYLRNPMYAGVSFTIFGIGLLLGSTAIVVAGLLWLGICFIVTLREEKRLEIRFEKDYLDYKKSSPRFIPDFQIIIRDVLIKIFYIEKTNKQKRIKRRIS